MADLLGDALSAQWAVKLELDWGKELHSLLHYESCGHHHLAMKVTNLDVVSLVSYRQTKV